jgi:hypothetical protein
VELPLNGSASFDPERARLAFAWGVASVPPGSRVTEANLVGRTLPAPTFVPDVVGEYVLQLLVNDGQLDSAPDFVTLTADPGPVPPNAVAEVDPVATVDQLVVLDGSASDDADTEMAQLTFHWTFAAVAAGSTLRNTDIAQAGTAVASFMPDVPGAYVLRLEVSDGQADDMAEVTLTVGVGDLPPNAIAGDDQAVFLGGDVTLDGSASIDPGAPPNVLTFRWHFVFVPPDSALTNAALHAVAATNVPRATGRRAARERVRFTPDVAGQYVVRLVVSDGTQEAGDNVLITALAGNRLVRLQGGGRAVHPQGGGDQVVLGLLGFLLLALGRHQARRRRWRRPES